MVLYTMSLNTNGHINMSIYRSFKKLGFDEHKRMRIGDLDICSIEGKLDEYIIVPKELQ